jgi:glycosyltransferase involved in cell wall biosynthesis
MVTLTNDDDAPPVLPATLGRPRSVEDLRIALFCANYNCVRDGANKTLNRLVEYLLAHGAAVRIYSPTVDDPPFRAVGDIVSVPSIALPGRPEYRFSLGLTPAIRDDVRRFRPTHFHISVPDLTGTQAQALASEMGVPAITSLHTRFETYLRFYRLGFLRPLVERRLKTFYSRADAVLAPSEPVADELRARGWATRIGIWGRGVDRDLFNPARRSDDWRRAHGFADEDVILLFLGAWSAKRGSTYSRPPWPSSVRGAIESVPS